MKLRLFWKILFAFWLTFFLISQATWLFITLDSDRTGPSSHARAEARMAVAAASNSFETGGQERYEHDTKAWPRDVQRQLTIAPVSAPLGTREILDQAIVVSPSGARYRISFEMWPTSWHRTPPNEVVIAGALGGLLFSALLAWYLTSPVRRMRSGFRRLARGDFTTRLAPSMGRRRDEIADLARDFDHMASQLNELVGARDRLLADVSHELRTPLARLNVAIGLARQDPAKSAASLDRIGIEAIKLDAMVGELLTLSKLESDARPVEEYFDLAEIVGSVVQDARYEAAAKQVDVVLADTAPSESEWIAKGNGMLVNRAIENVVRNAVRYSPQGNQVHLALERGAASYRLSIADNGPGVPNDEMRQLFEPFSHSADGLGFGLGLAIAQRAIAVMGGTIAARNRTAGGLEITITIPSSA
jgi:two-component system OmpR family sensor kinase